MREVAIQEPMMLLLLALAPMVALLLRWARKKRATALAAIGGSERVVSSRRDWWWVACFAVLALALARPGYNPVRLSSAQSGRDVVFVLDISRSMLAQDAYPSRLEAAKQGIRDCLDGFSGEQVALVIYAGSASIAAPLTSDYEFVRYMLSQVEPRSVEFGGTMLLSAVEKVVDQVLAKDRKGFQDVVVLTDGEDFGPEMERVQALVEESGATLLAVGLGDPDVGARIPVLNEKGETVSLKHEGNVIYTKLQSKSLTELAAMHSKNEYYGAGTLPFHLGDVYRDFAAGKESAASGGDAVYVVYQEGAFFLMPVALVLALLALGGVDLRRSTVTAAVSFLVALFVCNFLDAQEGEGAEPVSFERAGAYLAREQFGEAIAGFESLRMESENTGDRSSREVAALSFNLGLSQHLQAKAIAEASASTALGWAMAAQESFMRSLRENPELRRASLRLENISGLISTLEDKVEEEERERQEQQSQVEELLELLRALQENQLSLRDEVYEADRAQSARRKQGAPAEKADERPEVAADGFNRRQVALREEGERIHDLMKELDAEFAQKLQGVEAGAETVLKRPLELMGEVDEALALSVTLTQQWQDWAKARSSQKRVADKIQEVLDLFASNEGEDEEYDEWDEDWEEYSESEDGEGTPSSMAMEGDFKMDSMMQPLPVPNFSAEEILMEEMGSQQFRQQKRSEANAGKVEKDW